MPDEADYRTLAREAVAAADAGDNAAKLELMAFVEGAEPPEVRTLTLDTPLDRAGVDRLRREGWYVAGASRRGERYGRDGWVYSLSRLRPPPGET